jgi:hypothetical protein
MGLGQGAPRDYLMATWTSEPRAKEMEMNRSTRRERGVAAIFVSLFLLPATTAGAVDSKDVIKQARGAYYSLQARGFVAFRCNMTPNWEVLLQEERKTNPGGADRALRQLAGPQFVISLGADGAAKIARSAMAATKDQKPEEITQIYDDLEQSVSNVFATWFSFVNSPNLPAVDDTYQLEERGAQWHLTYKTGPLEVGTIMDKDFSIREWKATSPDLVMTLLPQFTATKEGLLLAGYQLNYSAKVPNPNDATQLQLRIAYQETNGLQLPQKMNLGGVYGGGAILFEVTFSDCVVTRQ